MAWIESHQHLQKHPKVYDLMNTMGWDLDTTIGKLHRFWWWCVDYAEDGDLRRHNNARLAISVGLDGSDGDKFIDAMIKSNWIDEKPYKKVHDWWDYFGKFLQIKYKHKPNIWKNIRKCYNNSSKNRYRNHIPNLTKPNHTIPNQPNLILSQNEILLDSFGEKLKEKILVYIDRIKLKNKSGVITEGRRATLLTELFNSRERCNNEAIFDYAVEQSIQRDACNIGYINAIIKNKKTEKPKENYIYHVSK